MLALIFIIIATGAGVFISLLMSTGDVSWLVYYRGGIIGLFLSGVVIYAMNNRRRAKEMREKK
jgi:hypothetical protein